MADINVFCDASIDKTTGRTCAGALAVNSDGTEMIAEQFVVQEQGTNNSGEILAVLMSILICIQFKFLGFKTFNIISDSRISIEGLRTWVFGWIKTQKEGLLYSSSGDLVANQDYFKEIIRLVVDNDLDIKFYHQKGHCGTNEKGLQTAEHFFCKSNGISSDQIGLDSRKIVAYNNYVDIMSRNVLYDNTIPHSIEKPRVVVYYIDEIYIERYRQLINQRIV